MAGKLSLAATVAPLDSKGVSGRDGHRHEHVRVQIFENLPRAGAKIGAN